MAYEKLFNEIYAALSLKYLWQEYRPSFIKSESPDWINEEMELGLEVSQALLPDDGQTKNFIEKYLGCLMEELPEVMMERYGERLYFYNGRFWAVLPDENKEQDYIYKAEYRFREKLEKLNTNYQRRRYNGLYLFLHPLNEYEIDAGELFLTMQQIQENRSQKFHWVFLNCRSKIYICNYIEDVFREIELPQNSADFLNKETERLRQNIVWKNGASIEMV